MRLPTRGRPARPKLVVAAGVAAVLVVAVTGAYVASPRTEGLAGEWSAPSSDGEVVAERALVSGGNAALDLRTGKSVRLSSVAGGAATYADDRLIVSKDGRVDSVRLDAPVRWTWRAPAGHVAIPLAAAAGSTLVADCPAGAGKTCRLVGLDSAGKPGWESAGAQRPHERPRPALPRLLAEQVEGGGVSLTDPTSGRASLQPGDSFVAVPDGPVIVPVQQGGQCVVSLFTAPDPLWTQLLGPCPGGRVPEVAATDGAVLLTWAGRVERLALGTGAALPPPSVRPVSGVLAAAGSLLATRRVDPPPAKAILPWRDSQVLELRDARSGEVRARLVTERPVTLLLLEADAVVVRVDSRVVRYSLDG